MYYTIYRITNLVNSKLYIGAHKTDNIEDGYMGSGKILGYAKDKYGLENFNKEILHTYDNTKEMYAKEKELVNEEFIARKDTYNIKIGGFGGFDYLNSADYDNPSHSAEHARMMYKVGYDKRVAAYNKLWEDPEFVVEWGRLSSERQKEQYQNGRVPAMLGKTHTNEAKRKIGKANSINQKGERNSQYGKPRSDAVKKKIAEALKNKPMLTCPHCKKEHNNVGVMNKWHFDKCKDKL